MVGKWDRRFERWWLVMGTIGYAGLVRVPQIGRHTHRSRR